MKKQLIRVFEWRKSVHYWWSYILFSPECKELTSMLDPLSYRWGVPPVVIRCVHWTMQMWVLQTWIKAQGLAIVMFTRLEDGWRMEGARGETVNDGTSVGGGRGTEMEGVVDRECHWKGFRRPGLGWRGGGGGGSRGHGVVGERDDGLEPKGG